MRRVKISIQWLMVAIIFLAIAFWSGPILAPEFVRRWRTCSNRAANYQSMARFWYIEAAKFSAYPKPEVGAGFQRRGDGYSKKAQRYRRALLVPWETWSLGEF